MMYTPSQAKHDAEYHDRCADDAPGAIHHVFDVRRASAPWMEKCKKCHMDLKTIAMSVVSLSAWHINMITLRWAFFAVVCLHQRYASHQSP